MIYLDYSATTPVSYDVLESFNKASKEYFGNPNSLHGVGLKAKELVREATKQISDLFNVGFDEIVYTSGATEANNLALIGGALANKKRGNHIIVSKLEHPSIYKICEYLETQGFKISYVDIDKDGLVDFTDLRKKINPETILVSICAVNSEVGVRQPLKMIRQIIKKENNNCLFHSDMTQSLGKTSLSLRDVDLASFSIHKIYGPKGIGILYKNNKVKINPIIQGSSKESKLRPGTTPVPLIAATAKAIRLSLQDLERRETFIKRLNEKVVKELSTYEGIKINQTKYSIPHILNISLDNIKSETFVHAMEDYDIYLGTNTACASGEFSSSVMAIYNDKKRASSTIRISISHLTTTDEINQFLNHFKTTYNKLNNLVTN